jgi:hypothetical protein
MHVKFKKPATGHIDAGFLCFQANSETPRKFPLLLEVPHAAVPNKIGQK